MSHYLSEDRSRVTGLFGSVSGGGEIGADSY